MIEKVNDEFVSLDVEINDLKRDLKDEWPLIKRLLVANILLLGGVVSFCLFKGSLWASVYFLAPICSFTFSTVQVASRICSKRKQLAEFRELRKTLVGHD